MTETTKTTKAKSTSAASTTAKTAAPAKRSSAPKAKKPAGAPVGPRGRKYREAADKVEAGKHYPLAEAVALVKDTSTTKFDSTVELHIRLGIDARTAEQSVRGTVQLPAGSGKDMKVLAFVPPAKQAAAKKAGADFVSDADTLKKIEDGWTGFDVSVATPDQMATVSKLGKVLGPKGLMPNPKSGTVTDDFETAIKQVKAGSVEFRVAADGTIHAGIGKVSFKADDLAKNVAAYYKAVNAAKPDDAKGVFIRSVTLASTMGPGIRLAPEGISA
ncbi:50S ribosomal protein L1 [Patescibacteria group bacterium]|nr:50S ribosomal protein L1 [Patescibacteria group bacterium]